MRRLFLGFFVAGVAVLLYFGPAHAQTATPTAAPGSSADAWRVWASNMCELDAWANCAVESWDGSSSITAAYGQAVLCHAYETGTGQSLVWSAWECYRANVESVRTGSEADGYWGYDDVLSIAASSSGIVGDRWAFVPPRGSVEHGYYCTAHFEGGGVGAYTVGMNTTLGSTPAGWTVAYSDGGTTNQDTGENTIQKVYTLPAATELGDAMVPARSYYMASQVTMVNALRYLTVWADEGTCYHWWRLADRFYEEATATPTPTPTETPIPGATATDTPTATVTATPTETSTPIPGATPTATPLPNYAATIIANWPTAMPTRNLATIEALLAVIAKTATPVPTATRPWTPTPFPTPVFGVGGVGPGQSETGFGGGVNPTAGCLRLFPGFQWAIPVEVRLWGLSVPVPVVGGRSVGMPKLEFCGASSTIPGLTVFNFPFASWAIALLSVGGLIAAYRVFSRG